MVGTFVYSLLVCILTLVENPSANSKGVESVMKTVVEARGKLPKISFQVQTTVFGKNGVWGSQTLSSHEEILDGDRILSRRMEKEYVNADGAVQAVDGYTAIVDDGKTLMVYVSRENSGGRWPATGLGRTVSSVIDEYASTHYLDVEPPMEVDDPMGRILVINGHRKDTAISSAFHVRLIFSKNGVLIFESTWNKYGKIEKMATTLNIDLNPPIDISKLSRDIPHDAVITDRNQGKGWGVKAPAGQNAKKKDGPVQ